jgi:hypothetical protein
MIDRKKIEALLDYAGIISPHPNTFIGELCATVKELLEVVPKSAYTPRDAPYTPRKELCALRREAISEYLGGWTRSPPLREIQEHLRDVVGLPASKGTIASDLCAMGVTNPRAWRYAA